MEAVMLKKLLKRFLPESAIAKISYLRALLGSSGMFRYDKRRFMAHYSARLKGASKAQLDARLVFSAHSLEKGLSHDDIRYGFGKSALNNLARAMQSYSDQRYPRDSKAYVNALSVINSYIELHKKASQDISFLAGIFEQKIIDEAKNCSARIGGASVISKSDKINNKEKNFEELFNGRYSIRTYSDKPVSMRDIRKAVEISLKTPSVCNRQPSRLYVINSGDLASKVLKVQGGFTGYTEPPMLLAITTSIESYVSPTERNQSFIDGGAFALAMLVSLEYLGLAACALNAMFDIRRDKAIRKLLNIPDSENIIMLIACGHFQEKNNVAKSFRYPVDDIMRIAKGK
jgi:nitroreductase